MINTIENAGNVEKNFFTFVLRPERPSSGLLINQFLINRNNSGYSNLRKRRAFGVQPLVHPPYSYDS